MKKKILKTMITIIFILSIIIVPKTLATNEFENETGNTSQNTQQDETNNNTNTSNTQTGNNEINTPGQTPQENENPTTTNPNNENSNNNNNSNRNPGTTTNNNSNNSHQTTRESSNANLSNLGIRPNDFSGFTPYTTTYKVTVPEDVEEVEIYAQTQDDNATVQGTGTISLEFGQNVAEVIVTAEDGTTKTYTINITRQGEEQQEGEIQTNTSEGIAELKIENVTIEPEFKTDIYEYNVKYIGEATQLNIEITPTNEEYIAEIVGNTDLQEGENIITILVTDEAGNNIATYQLIVNKSLVDYEAIARQEQEQKTRNLIMIALAIVVVIIVVTIIIIIRKRKNKAKDFKIPYSKIEDTENDEQYDEIDNNDEEQINEENSSINQEEKQKMKEKLRKELYSNYSVKDD